MFRTNAKIKVQCSCVPVKYFVAKSMTGDQVITTDGEIFRKVQVKYATPGGGLRCDPGQ